MSVVQLLRILSESQPHKSLSLTEGLAEQLKSHEVLPFSSDRLMLIAVLC